MKVIARLTLLLALLLTATASAWAAQRTVTGTVLDTQDEPLIGVSVMVEQTKAGCLTDVDGNFSLKVPDGPVTLKVSYLGYETSTVKVGANQTKVNVVLKESAIMLEETVVIGYGTQKKVNLTGAVASVDGSKLEGRTAPNISTMLQGSVPGLNITTSSGLPGASASINIRGQESINGGGPLVMVDGAVGDMDTVNPNDVESISVIKDASAAAVYGARAAYGVILITTKSGKNKDGRATVRYNGRVGWEEPTTSTDFITQGYWSAYYTNMFWQAAKHTNYLTYNDYDMQQLLARVNDKTEHPDRPWVVEETVGGKRQWKYYANTDWYHTLYRDKHPLTTHNISFSGGKDKFHYFLSGGLDYREGVGKLTKDTFHRYNMRSKLDFEVNKWVDISNNTSFYGSEYSYPGNDTMQDTFAYSARHALAMFPLKNPDGTWIYHANGYEGSYNVANGRHILMGEGSHRNMERKTDFTNTFRINIKPIEQLVITGDFTYRFSQNRNTYRSNPLPYREVPEGEMKYYNTGAGLNELEEKVNTRNYYSVNAFATYNDTFNDVHNVTAMVGYNYETYNYKNIGAIGDNIQSDELDDLNLQGPNDAGEIISKVSGGQAAYSIQGIFGRLNYDYRGRYLVELSGRYDGTSRFSKGHRWGFFPSGSLGWRFSEENFFEPLRTVVSNGKLRLSYGELGNQAVSEYYTWIRLISNHNFDNFSFGNTTVPAKYSSLADPVSSDLTWETAKQWDLGLDLGFFNNRLTFTGDIYQRTTVNMVTDGMQLPAVYGAGVPKMNNADLRTRGYELALNWNDGFNLFGHRFNYNVGFQLSQYKSEITKYKNNENLLLGSDNGNGSAGDYYEGMELGEIWGYRIDGLFQNQEEVDEYLSKVDPTHVMSGLPDGIQAGDCRFVDLDGNGEINYGIEGMISLNGKFYVPGDEGYDAAMADPDHKDVPVNSLYNHGDRVRLGNSLPRLQYGITAGFNYCGVDFSIFLQGTGNHNWYPHMQSMPFWGWYSYTYTSFAPTDLPGKIWSQDNPDSYFPRPMAYMSSSYYLKYMNDRYLQNMRYLRLKNLTVGYTLPKKWTKKAYMEKVRVYFSGENLAYWSPLKDNSKYIDPEAAFSRSNAALNNAFYPWNKTFMFGLDIQF